MTSLETNAAIYQQFIDRAHTIKVPETVANTHVDLLNNTYLLAGHIETMSQADSDPLGAMIAAGDYQLDEEALGLVLQAITLYLHGK